LRFFCSENGIYLAQLSSLQLDAFLLVCDFCAFFCNFCVFRGSFDRAAVRWPFVWFRDGSRWTGFSLPDFYCAPDGGNYRQRGGDGKLLEAGEMGWRCGGRLLTAKNDAGGTCVVVLWT